jgi:hypothetical protein
MDKILTMDVEITTTLSEMVKGETYWEGKIWKVLKQEFIEKYGNATEEDLGSQFDDVKYIRNNIDDLEDFKFICDYDGIKKATILDEDGNMVVYFPVEIDLDHALGKIYESKERGY